MQPSLRTRTQTTDPVYSGTTSISSLRRRPRARRRRWSWPYRDGAMQDVGYELRRIPIPRTRVNKGKRKGWVSKDPALLITASDLLLEVDYLKLAVFFCASRVAWGVYANGTLVNASAHCSKKRLCASSRSSRISKILLTSSSLDSV